MQWYMVETFETVQQRELYSEKVGLTNGQVQTTSSKAIPYVTLTVYPIYTHFSTLKKKNFKKTLWKKGEIAQHEQFHFFPQ